VEAAGEQDESCTVAWEQATAARAAAASPSPASSSAAAAAALAYSRRAQPADIDNPYATAALGLTSSASAAAAFDIAPDAAASAAGGGGAAGGDLEDSRHPPRYRLSDFTSSTAASRGLVDITPPAAAPSLWPAAAVPVRAGHAAALEVDHEWLRTTCLPALTALVRLQVRGLECLSA
jgi:hypothetical protein